jgi:hypothetical protein
MTIMSDPSTYGSADREPTPEEEREAERAAADVDLEQVSEHYEEMAERGAHVEGEGKIV